MGPRRLHHELGRDGLEPVPSRSAIYRALVRQRLIEPVARRRRRADYRRWERDRPIELWQLDVMGGVWLVDGQELKVVTGIDDHSRFCVMAGLVERTNARSVCRIYSSPAPGPWHGHPNRTVQRQRPQTTGADHAVFGSAAVHPATVGQGD